MFTSAFSRKALAAGTMLAWLSAHPATASNGQVSSPGAWGDFLAGYHAESIGQKSQAMDFYAAATRKNLPASADLYSRIYILGLTEGRLSDALAALAQVEEMGGKAPLANLVHTVEAFKNGNYTDAEDRMSGDENGITRLLGPALTAWALVGQGDLDGALQALEARPGQKGDVPPLQLLHAALIADLGGRYELAAEKFSQLRKATGLALRTAELMGQHLERQDQRPEAQMLYQAIAGDSGGDALVAAGAQRRSDGVYPPLDIDSPKKGAAEAIYNVASVLLSQGAWESALGLAHMAKALRPDFSYADLVIAGALDQSERRHEANALYEAIPSTSPLSWTARLRLADNYDRLEETDKAVKLFSIMARERPTDARPLIELGNVLRRHDRFREAADAYTRALQRIAEPGTRDWVLFYARGIAFEQTDRWSLAEADFLKALDLNPEQPLVLNYLGYSWIDQGLHLERALEMIRKAVELRPRDGYIVDSLGWGLYRMGDYPGAVKNLERATLLRPADPVINDHLGDALWQVGRTREARFQWERALGLKPDEDLAATLKQKLQSGLDGNKP